MRKTLISLFILLMCFGVAQAKNKACAEGLSCISPFGRMHIPRAAHTMTVLANGRVLITGGIRWDGDFVNSAEIYDPTSETFGLTNDMTTARASHTATLLNNGQVLIVGGVNPAALNTAELYDPDTAHFTATGSLATAREGFTATLLKDGRVLIVGGDDGENVLNSAEIYDPESGTFSLTGTLTVARAAHTASLLPDGRVLIAGGGWGDTVLASSEIYDPASGTFSAAGDMRTARYKHAAALLPDGHVLIVGGANSDDWTGRYNEAETFDPADGTFSSIHSMLYARFKFADSVVTMPDGNVLVVGAGLFIERYDSDSNTFEIMPGLLDDSRYFMGAVALPNGRVLITGGYDSDIYATNETWMYLPRGYNS